GHGERVDRGGGREGAAIDERVAERAGAAAPAAGIHRHRRIGDRAVHDQGAADDRGRAGVGVVASEDEGARPGFAQRAAPEMTAASVSVSVKLAAIWPPLTIAGVTIAPARPPTPRLSVLPAAIGVGLGELTPPPSAMVSAPTRLQPQPLSPPTVSELRAFRTEPAPVTVTVEAPVTSPMNIGAVALTVPPLATVSMPGPSVL